MVNPSNHTDLLIRIGAPLPETAAYPVEAMIDGDSLFYGGVLHVDWEQLRQWQLDPTRYGGELLGALFSAPIERVYERAVAKADELRTSIRQLFAQHSPQGGLQIRSALALDVFAQGFVDEGLVVSTAFYPIPKPLDDVRIEANGDPLLGRLDDRSTFAIGKIIFVAWLSLARSVDARRPWLAAPR